MFKPFKEKLQHYVTALLQHQQTLFVTNTDTALLWEFYLNSFPPGTNEIFRERQEYGSM